MQPVITSSLINPTASIARQALANPIFNVHLVGHSINHHGRGRCLHGVASSGHTASLRARSAKIRAWTSGSSDFAKASEKVSDAASTITRKLADLMKEVDAEAQQHFGSGEPVPSDSTEEPLAFKVDLLECADAYQCIAEMPGVSRESMQLKVDKERRLCIKAERRTSANATWSYTKQERHIGSLERKFELPEDADVSKLSAQLAEGVLTIRINKLRT